MNDVIDSVSYDQFKNIPTADEMGIDTKIILSSESYLKLLQMIKHTKDSEMETGCFFVGRQSENNPFSIYIDYFTSDFKCEDALIQGGSASPTQQVCDELNSELEKYNQLGKKACVFHFHTHPRMLHFESFSDQDLSLYAKMAYDNNNTNSFGMLGFPIPDAPNSNGLAIVQTIKPEIINGVGIANFFRFPNMYYCIKNEIYKIGTFEKQYEGRKHKTNLTRGIVKNAIEDSASNEVCAFGLNPNNGQPINDEAIGYIDANGTFCFPRENLILSFSRFKRKEDDFER